MPAVDVTTTGTFTVDPDDGNDTLIVYGTSDDDVVDVTDTTVDMTTPDRITVTYATSNTELLTVLTGAGDDRVNVAMGVTTRLSIDVGDPVASDEVYLTVADGARFTQGADSTTGLVDQLTGAADIDLANVERLHITSNTTDSNLTVRGTNDSDTIEASPISDPAASVWINDGTVVSFNETNGNFDDLNIEAGFGADNLTLTPIDGVSITTTGDAPSGGDAVLVNVDVATTVSSLAVDGATVAAAGHSDIVIQTAESLLINGTAPDIGLTVSGTGRFVHTPTSNVDAGTMQIDSLLAVNYVNLGTGATVTANGTGTADELILLATNLDDSVDVSAANAIDLESGFGDHINVLAGAIETLTLELFDGADATTVDGMNTFDTINVLGGAADNDDTLSLSNNTGPATLNLETAVISGYRGTLNYTGLASIELDANDQSLAVTATDGDDTLRITPATASTGVVSLSGAPTLHYAGINNDTISLFTAGGEDTLEVIGSPAAETIDIHTGSAAAGEVVASDQTIVHNLTATDALVVNAGSGDDIINVSAANHPIFIDGGDPIGSTNAGDAINVMSNSGDVTYVQGPQVDEGSFVVGTNAEVSFDHIEALSRDRRRHGCGECDRHDGRQ